MLHYNCFLIDLSKFSSQEEIASFLSDANISENNLSSENLWQTKIGNFTQGEEVISIWVDGTTFFAFAYATRTKQNFVTQFVEYLQNMSPLYPGEKYQAPDSFDLNLNSNLTIDDVLDKINSSGINSLNENELFILKNNS
jgi:hypothetical protein